MNYRRHAGYPQHVFSSCNKYSLLYCTYRQTADISVTESQNLNVSRPVLQLYLHNPLNPRIKTRMKIQMEQFRQALLQLNLSDQQFYCLSCDLYYRFDDSSQVIWSADACYAYQIREDAVFVRQFYSECSPPDQVNYDVYSIIHQNEN